MIFDTLKNCDKYFSVHPAFEKAFEFIKKAINENLEIGKYELDGKNLYALVQEYEPKAPNDKYEGHRNYIDIQFIISGDETMDCAHISKCEEIVPYNPEKDVAFFNCNKEFLHLECSANDFAVYFPEDIHKPGIKHNADKVRKVVVKIKA